jgi:hypothetical protein
MLPPISGGITKKKKLTIVYPNMPSALRPVPHGKGISVPEPPKEFIIDLDDEGESKSTSGSPEPLASTEPHVSHRGSPVPQPHILTQDELNDLVRDLKLSKSQAYWDQYLNDGIFARKMSEFLRFEVVISSWCLCLERKMILCSATM